MSPRLTSALVLAGVFLLGAVTGSGFTRFTMARSVHAFIDAPPPVVRQKALIAGLERAVRLDEQQRREVRAIVASHAAEARELRRLVEPRSEELKRKTFAEIRSVMRPDQLGAFQRFVERNEARGRVFRESDEAPRATP
jgi:hypothetical protein